MCTVLNDTIVTARKEHECNALVLIREFGLDELMAADFPPEENQELQKLLDNNGKILKGEKYRRYGFAGNGTVQTIKESIICSQLCQKYDLYPSDC